MLQFMICVTLDGMQENQQQSVNIINLRAASFVRD